MSEGFLIASNIIVPAITGLFCFIYFVYFVTVFHSKAPSFVYFVAFLLSFSLFILGRPLQLLLGKYPMPLIIVNIRMFIFCTVTITTITIASAYFSDQSAAHYNTRIFLIGFFFAFVYILFNTLGTKDSYPVFSWGDTVAYDGYTPTKNPPFYGREVTIAVQVLIGLLLVANSLYRLISGKKGKPWKFYFKDKVMLFNSGFFLFALMFTIGSFTKQWWLYYFTSIFSAMLFGAGVVIDIRELYNNYEKLVPIIKEDIIQNVAFSKNSRKKLTELLLCLGKSECLDTFSIILMKNSRFETGYELGALTAVTKICGRNLDDLIGRKNYLLIPLDDQKIGVVINLKAVSDLGEMNELELFEQLQNTIYGSTGFRTAIGIGRSCTDIANLHTSYQEAKHALECAADFEEGAIIHVDNIRDDRKTGPKYPTNEKLRLLSAIKLGNMGECLAALREFLDAFGPFIESNPESLKIRLYELIGAFLDSAITAGGDEEKLNIIVKEWLADIDRISSYEMASQWLEEIVQNIVRFMSRIRKTRSSMIVEKAKDIINSRYASQISYRDVAKELFISSSYFLSLFKQETNSTFVEYLTRVRIDRSKELLQRTHKNITEISYEVGFTNPNYFSSTFKKVSGISAKEFRCDNTLSPAES